MSTFKKTIYKKNSLSFSVKFKLAPPSAPKITAQLLSSVLRATHPPLGGELFHAAAWKAHCTEVEVLKQAIGARERELDRAAPKKLIDAVQSAETAFKAGLNECRNIRRRMLRVRKNERIQQGKDRLLAIGGGKFDKEMMAGANILCLMSGV